MKLGWNFLVRLGEGEPPGQPVELHHLWVVLLEGSSEGFFSQVILS